MKSKKSPKRLLKIPAQEELVYKRAFCFYFIKNNPDFVEEVKSSLIPLYLEIFGKYIELTGFLLEMNWTLSTAVIQTDYELFAIQIKSLLEVELEKQPQTTDDFKNKCDQLLNKILEVALCHNLFFETSEISIKQWLIHTLLGQIESGKADWMIPEYPPAPKVPLGALKEIWQAFPVLQQIYLMKLHQELITNSYSSKENISNLTEIGHHFESIDNYFNSPYFNLNIPPPIFQSRGFNFDDDFEEYQKEVVKSYQRHLKLYFKNIKFILKKHGFKEFKRDYYEQVEWLVIWNKKQYAFLWEVIPDIPEFQDVDVNNDLKRDKAVNKISKAFKKFRTFELPIRPYGN